MSDVIYKCKLDGVVGRRGKHVGMCGYIKCGSKSLCGAPVTVECHHKTVEDDSEFMRVNKEMESDV